MKEADYTIFSLIILFFDKKKKKKKKKKKNRNTLNIAGYSKSLYKSANLNMSFQEVEIERVYETSKVYERIKSLLNLESCCFK